jgi:hypothetical protein
MYLFIFDTDGIDPSSDIVPIPMASLLRIINDFFVLAFISSPNRTCVCRCTRTVREPRGTGVLVDSAGRSNIGATKWR